jgi:hypothetical protein
MKNIASFVAFILTLASAAEPKAKFPLQLSADISITAHLIPEEQTYPPRIRKMRIYYDYLGKRARADIAPGYEAEKTYIRRYDLEKEYMIRAAPIDDCKRSYLGEIMPYPELTGASFLNKETIDGEPVLHFVSEDFETLVHIYMSESTGAPVRLTQGSFVNGIFTPLLTYDYSAVSLLEPEDDLFEIPAPFRHDLCDFHTGGFPYLHVFHYFVRF